MRRSSSRRRPSRRPCSAIAGYVSPHPHTGLLLHLYVRSHGRPHVVRLAPVVRNAMPGGVIADPPTDGSATGRLAVEAHFAPSSVSSPATAAPGADPERANGLALNLDRTGWAANRGQVAAHKSAARRLRLLNLRTLDDDADQSPTHALPCVPSNWGRPGPCPRRASGASLRSR
jgi:hypothetical protein